MSADGKKLLYVERQQLVDRADDEEDRARRKGGINVDGIEVRIDPRAEWTQIFDEAWRINRDYFYAPNMHGVDWKQQREKYAAFLPHLATRADLNRVMQWMSSELAVGHHRVGGGDGSPSRRTFPAVCSAPTTRSRTAATGSRRSTAA